ncbi:adhesion G-protein coupled receptor G6-like isoform X2 [Tubulanus polymorphus]|uniref:adhesion G-protein coupled receptor G6-like isoform X2 n=1 Tax=Tubulanus polymorphus TaxID=672921 RepID=UPI003DA22601
MAKFSLPLSAFCLIILLNKSLVSDGRGDASSCCDIKTEKFVCCFISLCDGNVSRLELDSSFKRKCICKDEFKDYVNLNSLNLSNNLIKYVHEDAFSHNENLEVLDLSYNNISTLKKETFENTAKLKFLNLSNNHIKSIHEGAFSYNENLEVLNLSYNNIITLHQDTFENTAKLKYLDLSYNNISTLKKETFENTAKLKYLYLTDNRIDCSLNNTLFKHISELTLVCADSKCTNNCIEETDSFSDFISSCSPGHSSVSQRMKPTTTSKPTITTDMHLNKGGKSRKAFQNLYNLTGKRRKGKKDVTESLEAIDTILSDEEIFGSLVQSETVRGLVDAFSDLIDVNQTVLDEIQNSNNSIRKVLKQIEHLSNKIVVYGNESITVRQKNIELRVISPDSIEDKGMTLHFSAEDGTDETNVYLPKSISKENETVKIVFYPNTALFQALEAQGRRNVVSQGFLTSKVLAVSVGMHEKADLPQPIILKFRNLNRQDPTKQSVVRCVFWDFMANDGKGNWSTEGCLTTVTVSGITSCECNHLTNFALLMNVYDASSRQISTQQNRSLSILSIAGCVLSLVGLFLTLLTYIMFRKLRKSIPSQLLICLCVALFCVDIVFLFESSVKIDMTLCKIAAVLLHYFLLSSFTWMLIEAFYMYLALIKVFQPYFNRILLKFSLVGWGLPLIIVIITMAVSFQSYGLQGASGQNICWLKEKAFYGAFLAPVCLILLINSATFVMVIKQIHQMTKRRAMHVTNQEKMSISSQIKGAIGVLLLLGLTWIFGLLSIKETATSIFSYIFVLLNALQGLFIFVFYCVLKKEVRVAWKNVLDKKDTVFLSNNKGTHSTTLSETKTRKLSHAESFHKTSMDKTMESPRCKNIEMEENGHKPSTSSRETVI